VKPLPTLVTTVLAMSLIWFAVIGPPSAAVKPGPTVTPPPAELASKAAPIGAALAGASMADRLVWAEVWEKAGKAAAGETPDGEPIFTTTRGMRAFTVAALDVAWRRIRGVQPGNYPKLREAVEAFLADPAVLGREDVAASEDDRRRYEAACKAIAWAGLPRG